MLKMVAVAQTGHAAIAHRSARMLDIITRHRALGSSLWRTWDPPSDPRYGGPSLVDLRYGGPVPVFVGGCQGIVRVPGFKLPLLVSTFCRHVCVSVN
jgi:hypothetical protein